MVNRGKRVQRWKCLEKSPVMLPWKEDVLLLVEPFPSFGYERNIYHIYRNIYIYTCLYIYAYICMMHVCIVYWSPNALLVSTSTCQKFHSTFQCLSRSFCICGNLEATPTCTMIHHQPMVKVGGCGSGGSACSKRQHNPFPLRILRIGSSNLHHQWILDRNQVSEILLKKTSMFHQSRMKTHLPR